MKNAIRRITALALAVMTLCGGVSCGKDKPEGKHRVKVAVSYKSPMLCSAAERYNSTHEDSFIELVEYAPSEDTEAENTADDLSLEIAAGDYPDIIDLSITEDPELDSMGMFTDLYPFLDSDDELSRESFFPGVFAACEKEGKLLSLPGKAIHHRNDLLRGDRLANILIIAAAQKTSFRNSYNAVQHITSVLANKERYVSLFGLFRWDQNHHIPTVSQHRKHTAAGNRKGGLTAVFQLQANHFSQRFHWHRDCLHAASPFKGLSWLHEIPLPLRRHYGSKAPKREFLESVCPSASAGDPLPAGAVST